MSKPPKSKVPDGQPIRQRDIDSDRLVRKARADRKTVSEMDAGERLARGRQFTFESRFAEALDEYVWFHEHALEFDRSYYGVRLSFALGGWMNLAAAYPPALRKLESIRDRETSILQNGKGTRDLFHDVVAINRNLDEPQKTYALLKKLELTNPALAKECGVLAIDAIVEAGDFTMAQRHWPMAEEALLKFSDALNNDVTQYKGSSPKFPPRLQAYVSIYCNAVGTTIKIMRGLGDKKNLPYARDWAVALVHDRAVRIQVAERLFLDARSMN